MPATAKQRPGCRSGWATRIGRPKHAGGPATLGELYELALVEQAKQAQRALSPRADKD